MVVSAKSLPRGNLGRNFAEHRGTADLLRAGDADVIISTVSAGSHAPDQAKELILCRGLCAVDAEKHVRRNCNPPSVELSFPATSLVAAPSPQGETTNAWPHVPKNPASNAIFPGDIYPRHIIIVRAFSVISQETSLPVTSGPSNSPCH